MRKSPIKKTLLLALMLVTGYAWGEWVRVSWNDNFDRYIDPSTIRKDGNLVRVWEITDLKQRHKDGELSRRTRNEYDCKQERYRILTISSHTGPMASGTTLATEGESFTWDYIPPNSIVETVLKKLCAK